jgi:hypothetical protein
VSVKNVAGVPQYELWYVVRAAVLKGGTAALIVTAVDWPTRPGIIAFDIKESNIQMVY